MSESLAVKYRPQTFDEVVGHKTIVKAIQGALKRGNSHVFLFNGGSGVGKTTLAKICANAVGCTEASIIEVDAATHTGVDNIREIQEMLRYLPMSGGKCRALILDECHMLSKGAWNALLKILENPPKHVYWFLCTTELAKVPKTIQTRCHRSNLSALKPVDLKKVLSRVIEAEEIEISSKIVDVAIAEAYGSPRAAISNLEVCLDAKNVKQAAELLESAVGSDATIALARLLVGGRANWKSAMEAIADMKESPESVRIVVSNYVAAVLKNQTRKEEIQRYLSILEAFETPYNQSDKLAPLLLSIGRCLY